MLRINLSNHKRSRVGVPSTNKLLASPLPFPSYGFSFVQFPTRGEGTDYDFLSPSSLASFLINGVKRSMGTGKMMVEFFSVATSARVERNLN